MRRTGRMLAALVVALLVAVLPRSARSELPRLSARIEGLGVVPFDQATRGQWPLLRLDVEAEQSFLDRFRWRVSLIGRWGGTLENVDGPGLINFRQTFQNFSPSLELNEATLSYRGKEVDVSIGKQIFTWGRLDGYRPNDVLNPRIYLDPFVTPEIEQKIAVPALAVSYYFPDAWRSFLPEEFQTTLVWVPFDLVWRFPLENERWFPPAALLPGQLSLASVPGVPCPCTVDVEQTLGRTAPPAWRLNNGNLGARVSGRTERVDWAVTYFDGYDSSASFDLDVAVDLGVNDPTTPTLEARADTVLRPAYVRYRSLGVDLARPVAGATVRFEAAYQFRRPFPFQVSRLPEMIIADDKAREALIHGDTVSFDAFAKRDAVVWGLGADYLFDGGLFALVEVNQTALVANDEDLLVPNIDTQLAMSLRKTFLDRINVELSGAWSIEAGAELARGEVSYDVASGLSLSLGAIGIWGSKNSLIGQYKRNSELFGRVTYHF